MSKLNYTPKTFEETISRANKKAEKSGKEIYVIYKEGSGYGVADIEDFKEFFMMNGYEILYSTN